MINNELAHLKRIEQLFRMAEESADVGVWEWDILNERLFWTDQIYKIFDIDKEKFGASYDYFISRVHEEDRQAVQDAVNNSLADENTPYQIEHRIQDTKGNVKWVMETGKVYRSDCGEPIRMIGVVQNINKIVEGREKNEQLLDELIKKQEGIDAIAIFSETDTSGKITTVNDKFCEISKYSVDDLIGSDHRIINSGYHPKSFWKEAWEVIKSGKIWRGEVCNRAKDGSYYWVETAIMPSFDGEGKIIGYRSVRVDITKKKESEQRLNHAAKLASIGELAAGVGHEINNPLAVLLGNLEMAQKHMENRDIIDAKLKDYCEKMGGAVERIANIVDGLRTFARQDGEEEELVEVDESIRQSLSMITEIYAKNGVEIEYKPGQSTYYFKGTRGKFQQIVINLISNARDAFEGKEGRSVSVEVSTKDNNRNISVKVIDNGNGIPISAQEKIFDPFYTTKEVGKGTGLGLGLSREMARQMQGDLSFISEEGKGTTFELTLPLAEEVFKGEEGNENSSDIVENELSILIVDDEEQIRSFLMDLISSETSSQIDIAKDGMEGYEFLLRTEYDFVFTDQNMPGCSGLEMIKKYYQASAQKKEPQFILMSGGTVEEHLKGEEDDQMKKIKLLAKPFKIQKVLDLIAAN